MQTGEPLKRRGWTSVGTPRPRSSSEGPIRAALTRTSSAPSLRRARRAVFPPPWRGFPSAREERKDDLESQLSHCRCHRLSGRSGGLRFPFPSLLLARVMDHRGKTRGTGMVSLPVAIVVRSEVIPLAHQLARTRSVPPPPPRPPSTHLNSLGYGVDQNILATITPDIQSPQGQMAVRVQVSTEQCRKGRFEGEGGEVIPEKTRRLSTSSDTISTSTKTSVNSSNENRTLFASVGSDGSAAPRTRSPRERLPNSHLHFGWTRDPAPSFHSTSSPWQSGRGKDNAGEGFFLPPANTKGSLLAIRQRSPRSNEQTAEAPICRGLSSLAYSSLISKNFPIPSYISSWGRNGNVREEGMKRTENGGEATPFLIDPHVIGVHNCEVFIYWRVVTQDVSGFEPGTSRIPDRRRHGRPVTARARSTMTRTRIRITESDTQHTPFLQAVHGKPISTHETHEDTGNVRIHVGKLGISQLLRVPESLWPIGIEYLWRPIASCPYDEIELIFTWHDNRKPFWRHSATKGFGRAESEQRHKRRRLRRSIAKEWLDCSPPSKAKRVRFTAGSHVVIVPDDAADRRVFSAISPSPYPYFSALLASLHPHRLSRPPPCRGPPKSLHSFTTRYTGHL
ncbi:hypothetical protein PR048_010446 [Dryococelus australis]|uniref:Uncharacterized protein n=1 Tax=Dryococelus australis TaxID=614101 RepID=A0ABQ9I2T9_9NEOP|nr:hypothetical protein PR048_010446 [Dryococelus australis]